MKYTIILPAMVESVAMPCIESLAPEVKRHLIIIDNSPEGFAHKLNIRHYQHPINIGVASSWNVGVRSVITNKHDYLIILSTAIIFNKGMLDFIELLESDKLEPKHMRPFGVESQFAWHLIAIGRPTLERCGYFDTNFYPAYYEETDYIRRMELAGCLDVLDPKEHFPYVKVDAKRQGIALSMKHGLQVNMGGLHDYWLRKWGVTAEYDTQAQRDEMYDHPFNDINNSIKYWEKHSVDELKRMYQL